MLTLNPTGLMLTEESPLTYSATKVIGRAEKWPVLSCTAVNSCLSSMTGLGATHLVQSYGRGLGFSSRRSLAHDAHSYHCETGKAQSQESKR